MFGGESSDESDDSNYAEDGIDLDCNNHKLDAVQNQELYSTYCIIHISNFHRILSDSFEYRNSQKMTFSITFHTYFSLRINPTSIFS